ncbi:hypothetical protein SAMN06265348_108198 [Pedobacter westerhofensis]|uniref:Beta/Gamma crystallin n=1 Tax=Pedobacter westerhofensis TaxID=425512 RepID=A0A521EIQ3_9SPHI|nr:hypothetical protein [Pedobacter westerhofensis]SMO83803.1 hypothetical protein SAMN06265348_108198 [Pedobacter westerhofensis]
MKTLFKIFIFLTVFVVGSSAKAQSGLVIFRENNEGTGKTIKQLTDSPATYDLTQVGGNDEIRSVVLVNVRVGAVISVFNDNTGSSGHAYTVITVKSSGQFTLGGFEGSWEDGNLKVDYRPFGNDRELDGKVSFIRIE